jgi:hypothetical protein
VQVTQFLGLAYGEARTPNSAAGRCTPSFAIRTTSSCRKRLASQRSPLSS